MSERRNGLRDSLPSLIPMVVTTRRMAARPSNDLRRVRSPHPSSLEFRSVYPLMTRRFEIHVLRSGLDPHTTPLVCSSSTASAVSSR